MWIKAENGDFVNLDHFDRIGVWPSEKGPSIRAQNYGADPVTIKNFTDAEGKPPASEQVSKVMDMIQAGMRKHGRWIDADAPIIQAPVMARARTKTGYA